VSRRLPTLLLTAALVVVPAVAASAAGSHGLEARTKAKARAAAHKLEHQLDSHRSVVVGGTVVSATADDPAVEGDAGSLVLTVHGGRFKALRGTDVTVTVAETARVTREGEATLADLVAGDHVVVRLTGVDLSVARQEGSWALVGTATGKRVAASPADDATETESPDATETTAG
jgi:hypothetical protein